ncbi:MAG TPA: hypothetical protein VM166_14955 [Gemmatimonadaceae bacterium]|nr:hypothetical protein [Gemmatimonadaceae bacterium]
MKPARLIIAVVLCTAFSAGIALASWYDDYYAGLTACRKGQWQLAAQKMTAAINSNGKEGENVRTYGAIFIPYHPYYYRGVANLNLGKYEQAIADLEKTTGPGQENLGSIGELLQRAKTQLADASTPPPPVADTRPPVTHTVAPPVTNTQPAAPAIDNALRGRARAALDQAKNALVAAQQRNAANTPEYRAAQDQYMKANSRWAAAKSNDELSQLLVDADNIALAAGSAQAATIADTRPPITSTTSTSRIGGAGGIVLGGIQADLQRALEDYFNGEFEDAERRFVSLTKQMPNNGWLWAFLGASQYSQYAFEGELRDKDKAMQSFRTAKKLRRWGDGLPAKYFSRRIRNAFKENA